MAIAPKQLALITCFFVSSAVLLGCPLMMPVMMAPALLMDHDSERMIEKAISELAASQAYYRKIALGRVESEGNLLPTDQLRKMIEESIISSKVLTLVENYPEAGLRESAQEASIEADGILDAELSRVETRDRLDLRLTDAGSGKVVWEKRYFPSENGSPLFRHH